MKNKDKKTLLNVFVLLAVALSIAQFFFPVNSVNTNDYPEEFIYDAKQENYILLCRFINYNEDGSVNRIITMPLYQGQKKGITLRQNIQSTSDAVVPVSMIVSLGMILYSLFFYFSYKGIKYCGIKKTRFFLYSAITMILNTVSVFLGTFFIFDHFGFNTKYIRFELSFYYMMLSIILFSIAYIIQSRFIDYSEDKPTIEKVFFEKYEEE